MDGLPSFERWLDQVGTGERADGFDDWVTLADWITRELARSGAELSDDEQSFLRLVKGFGVAIIELCNIEHDKHGRGAEDVLRSMPRVLGLMAVYAAGSALRADTPWRQIAKMMTLEFDRAAKFAADNLTQSDREG